MLDTTKSNSAPVNNLTSLQRLLEILLCATTIKIQEDVIKAEIARMLNSKSIEEISNLLQVCALPQHDLLLESKRVSLWMLRFMLSPVFLLLSTKITTRLHLTFKAPITDETILKEIFKKLQEKLPEKTTEQLQKQSQEQLPEKTTEQNPLFEFLDGTYHEFQVFYSNKEQPDAKIEYQEDDEIHIAVLGTNHVLAKVQLKHLEEKLKEKDIDKTRVHIHLLCKSGQNAVIQEAYGAEFAEDTRGEADEMDEIFKNKGFAEVKKHTVEGKYIGTEPTLEKFYQDYNGQLPKNLIFLCCPNTLNRQVADIKLFLAKKQVPQDIENSIQFITFSQQETAERLNKLLETASENERKIIEFFLKLEIILSSFFAEMAKELYAVLQMQKLNKDEQQPGTPSEKGTGQSDIATEESAEPLSSPLRSEKLSGENSKEQNKGTEQEQHEQNKGTEREQDTENGILTQDRGSVIEAIGQRGTGCCIM